MQLMESPGLIEAEHTLMSLTDVFAAAPHGARTGALRRDAGFVVVCARCGVACRASEVYWGRGRRLGEHPDHYYSPACGCSLHHAGYRRPTPAELDELRRRTAILAGKLADHPSAPTVGSAARAAVGV